jgi:hypothetical protein
MEVMNATQNEDEQHSEPVSEQDYHDAIPAQMKQHMWAALEHKAGLGKHPGKYSGPEHPGVHEDEVTDTDLDRAREGEISHKKMKAAMRGGDLGPGEFEQAQARQTQAMQQGAALSGGVQAAQAQGAQAGVTPQSAPAGSAGVTTPYPAQAKPGAVPTTGRAPQQQQSQQPPPAAPGQEEAPEEEPG